jgi:hypothetical protein
MMHGLMDYDYGILHASPIWATSGCWLPPSVVRR